jgi:hypothetical protein
MEWPSHSAANACLPTWERAILGHTNGDVLSQSLRDVNIPRRDFDVEPTQQPERV